MFEWICTITLYAMIMFIFCAFWILMGCLIYMGITFLIETWGKHND